MKSTSFARVRRCLPRLDGGLLAVYLAGAVSAVSWPLLLVLLGLVLDLIYAQGQATRGTWLGLLQQAVPELSSKERCLGALLLVGAALGALECLSGWLLDRAVKSVSQGVATRLRGELRRQAFHLGSSELFGPREVQPVQLFTEKVETVRQGLVVWWSTVPWEWLRFALLVALALALQVWLALAAILLAALVWMLASSLEGRAKSRQALLADRASHFMSLLTEGLRQVRLVRGYLLDDVPGEPFDDSLSRYHRAALARHAAEGSGRTLIRLTVFLAAALMLGLAGLNVLREPPRVRVDEVFVLYAALICAWFPLRRLRALPAEVQRAERASADVFAYLDREPGVGQSPDAAILDPLNHNLELIDVTLLDGAGRKLLDDVSLRIPAGSRVALVSLDHHLPLALAGLFPRFYDPQHGQVLFDKKDARYCTLASIREQVTLVPGDGVLFTGDVPENISCGDEQYSVQQIAEAAKRARAYDFIQKLPQGFATVVGQHGMRLTSSQQFRIGLARAMLREPAVVIVEEPAEEPEAAAGELLDEALAELSKQRTLISLPARLSTLRNADRVFLLHEGKLVAEGTHVELLQASELYRHLIYLKFNAFRESNGKG